MSGWAVGYIWPSGKSSPFNDLSPVIVADVNDIDPLDPRQQKQVDRRRNALYAKYGNESSISTIADQGLERIHPRFWQLFLFTEYEFVSFCTYYIIIYR
jgi:hypothetical protein